jgi:hypothetical protein
MSADDTQPSQPKLPDKDATEPSNPSTLPAHLEMDPEVTALSDDEVVEMARFYTKKFEPSDREIHRYIRHEINGGLGNFKAIQHLLSRLKDNESAKAAESLSATIILSLRGLITVAIENDFPAEK